jgi:hypothetical protein
VAAPSFTARYAEGEPVKTDSSNPSDMASVDETKPLVPACTYSRYRKDHNVEIALVYFFHPAAGQVNGAFALSLSFPLN